MEGVRFVLRCYRVVKRSRYGGLLVMASLVVGGVCDRGEAAVRHGPGVAAGAVPDRSTPSALDLLVAGRERLITGEFTSIEVSCSPGSPESQFCRSEIYCVFDHAKDTLRFDRVQDFQVNHAQSGAVSRAGDEVSAAESLPAETVTMRFVQSAEASMCWTSLQRHEVQIKAVEELPASLHPFDASSVGLATTGDLPKFPDVHRLCEVFSGQELIEDAEQADGLRRVVWSFGDGRLRRTLWMDPQLDFAPVRMDVQEIPPDTTGTAAVPYLL